MSSPLRLRERLGFRPKVPPSANPPSTPTTFVPTGNQAFDRAFEQLLEELDVKERNAFQKAHHQVDAQSLLERVKKLDEEDKTTGPRRFLGPVEKLLGILNQLMQGVAIGIQASPDISSLVVGGFKLILDVALKYVEYFKKLTEMIGRLADHLSHLEEFSKHANISIVQTSAINVYGGLLRFCRAAHLVFRNELDQSRKHVAIRSFVQAQWQPFETKFGGIDSDVQHYLHVLELSAQAATLSTSLRAAKRIEFLKWISTIDFDEVQTSIFQKRWSGTVQWLCDHRDFQTWFSSAQSSFLWCYGAPGVGKSVLTSTVIDYIQKARKLRDRNGLTFAYFRYNLEDVQTPAKIAAALIKQLCRIIDDIPNQLLEAFKLYQQNDRQPGFEELKQMFLLLAQNLDTVFIVVDALDECAEKPRSTLLGFFFDLTKEFHCAKVFVTSRPESRISNFFQDLQIPTIRIEAKKVQSDIERYVAGQLDSLLSNDGRPRTQTLRLRDPTLKTKIYDRLTQSADGIFLWVDLQLDNICRQRSDKDIECALSELPKGLRETYTRIVMQIQEQPESLQILARKCLQWVLNSRQPLTLYELRDAVTIANNSTTSEDFMKDREQYDVLDLVDVCKNLVTEFVKKNYTEERPLSQYVVKGWTIVKPVHYSVQEYFMKLPNKHDINEEFQKLGNAGQINNEIGKASITYLDLLYLHLGPAREFNTIRRSLRRNQLPLAWYCARFFDHHVLQAPSSSNDLYDIVDGLLSKNYRALTALMQLRYLRKPYQKIDFRIFYRSVSPSVVIASTRLAEMTLYWNSPKWPQLAVGGYALHHACATSALPQIELLLEGGSDPNFVDDRGKTPLSIAVQRNDQKVARALLGRRVTINLQNAEYAAHLGGLDFVKLLLEFGSEGPMKSDTPAEAVYRAFTRGKKQVAACLLQAGAEPQGAMLVIAAQRGWLDCVELILGAGIGIETATVEGTALHTACLYGRTEVVNLLLQHGANVYADTKYPCNALWAAACGCHLEVVMLLLSYGADPNQWTPRSGAPLVQAALYSDRLITTALLGAGADVNAKDDEFGSSLIASVMKEYTSDSKVSNNERLSKSSRNVNIDLLAKRENVTDILLTAGADVNVLGPNGTALSQACETGDAERFGLLLRSGADMQLTAPGRETCLTFAVRSGNLSIVQTLLENGANVNCDIGMKLLDSGAVCHIEAQEGNFPKARGLPPQTDKPLLRACLGGHSDIVKMLLDAGADAQATGPYGTTLETALVGYFYIGDDNNYGDVIKLLRAAQVPEPDCQCHDGFWCQSPACRRKPGDIPQWITGSRFRCRQCRQLDLCAGCVMMLRNDPDALGSHHRHKGSHDLTEFQHPGHLGKEESLNRGSRQIYP